MFMRYTGIKISMSIQASISMAYQHWNGAIQGKKFGDDRTTSFQPTFFSYLVDAYTLRYKNCSISVFAFSLTKLN